MSAPAPAPAVAFVFSERDWRQRWGRYLADHGGAELVAVLPDAAAVREADFAVLVVDDHWSGADRALVDECRAAGRAVVGVWDSEEPSGAERLASWGVDRTLESTADAVAFVAAVASLDSATLRARVVEEAQAVLGLGAGAATAGRRGSGGGGGEGPSRGAVVAVAGPVGATEAATEVAVELARSAAARGRRVSLVDADEVTPSVAQRLGLPLLPNVRVAVDAVRSPRSGRLADALLAVPAGGFDVVGGLADASQWADLRPRELLGVVDALAGSRDLVVVKAGPLAEDLAGGGGPERFGLSRAVLAAADAVVAVGVASPAGLVRLVSWAADVAPLVAGPLHAALADAPKDRFSQDELAAELRAACPRLASLSLLPPDRRPSEAAWHGALVPKGPFTRAVAELAALLAPLDAGAARRRGPWRRLRRGAPAPAPPVPVLESDRGRP